MTSITRNTLILRCTLSAATHVSRTWFASYRIWTNSYILRVVALTATRAISTTRRATTKLITTGRTTLSLLIHISRWHAWSASQGTPIIKFDTSTTCYSEIGTFITERDEVNAFLTGWVQEVPISLASAHFSRFIKVSLISTNTTTFSIDKFQGGALAFVALGVRTTFSTILQSLVT